MKDDYLGCGVNHDISERALNYAFLREFLLESKNNDDNFWVTWVSNLLGYEDEQDIDFLLQKLEKFIEISNSSKKFGL